MKPPSYTPTPHVIKCMLQTLETKTKPMCMACLRLHNILLYTCR